MTQRRAGAGDAVSARSGEAGRRTPRRTTASHAARRSRRGDRQAPLRRWQRAQQGDGQLVLIVGEPGLGKSRLIEEFHARLRETPHT